MNILITILPIVYACFVILRSSEKRAARFRKTESRLAVKTSDKSSWILNEQFSMEFFYLHLGLYGMHRTIFIAMMMNEIGYFRAIYCF